MQLVGQRGPLIGMVCNYDIIFLIIKFLFHNNLGVGERFLTLVLICGGM